ncbi:MAG: peptidylprolyl isomerase [Thermoanaerobaculia bacterium]
MKRYLLWSLLAALALPAAARAAVVNRIVLRVNDQIATLADYRERKQERTRMLQAADLESAQRKQLMLTVGRATMRTILDELLLLSRAEQLGVQVSEADVDQAVTRSREQAGIESDEDFQQALAQSGLMLPAYREQLRRNLLMDQVIGREVRARIELDEQTLRRHYRQHGDEFHEPERLRLEEVVLLETSGRPDEELRRIARQIAAEVVGGRSFNDAVTPFSRDGVATAVIDLGWIERRDLDPALADAAWELAPGEVSAPVPGRGGQHVMRLVERREARQVPFEEVREEVRRRVGAERFQKDLETYLEDLSAKAYVVAEVPPDARGFRDFGEESAEQLTETVAGTAGEAAETETETETEATPEPPSPAEPQPQPQTPSEAPPATPEP